MKQAELAHYRAMLLAQAADAPKRGLFAPRPKACAAPVLNLVAGDVISTPRAGRPVLREGSLFGRRPVEPTEPDAPMILDTPVGSAGRLRLHAPAGSRHLAETPFHAEDLADPPLATGPTPGVIAGWSAAKPPSAQVRLLRRLGAVIEAERQGLAARLAAAGIEAA